MLLMLRYVFVTWPLDTEHMPLFNRLSLGLQLRSLLSREYRALFKAIKHQPTDFESAMETVQCIITGIKNSVMQPGEYEHTGLFV